MIILTQTLREANLTEWNAFECLGAWIAEVSSYHFHPNLEVVDVLVKEKFPNADYLANFKITVYNYRDEDDYLILTGDVYKYVPESQRPVPVYPGLIPMFTDCELCNVCQRPIMETGTALDGKPVHIKCYHKEQ